jgi:acetyltransferase-like isoleucine patch superfamily enzyme
MADPKTEKNKTLPDDVFAAGNPARVVRGLPD